MKTLRRSDMTEWQARVKSVAPDAEPRWGSMDAATMLAHLRRHVETALGEHDVSDRSKPVLRSLFVAIMWLSPIPKGRAPAPDWMMPDPAAVEDERTGLLEAMERFCAALESDPGRRAVNPALGSQPLRRWAWQIGKHMDHHLRQFGA